MAGVEAEAGEASSASIGLGSRPVIAVGVVKFDAVVESIGWEQTVSTEASETVASDGVDLIAVGAEDANA